MKKSSKMFFLTTLVLLIFTPGIVWLFLAGQIDSENYENRELTPVPNFCVQTYYNYPRQFDAYFNDHMPFRNFLIQMNAYIDYKFLRIPSNRNVIVGSDKWLFYGSEDDGNPIATYEGSDTLDLKAMENLEASLRWSQDCLERQGITFSVIVAPNKENIYYEKMPGSFHKCDVSSTDILLQYLSEQGISIVDINPGLINNKKDLLLYYKYDTHWNLLGGYIAVNDIMASWGLEYEDIKSRNIQEESLKGQYHPSGEDDLATMLNLRSWVFADEKEYTIVGCPNVDWDKISEDFIFLENPNAEYEKTVVLLGDSFRLAMVPALLERFQKVYACNRKNFDILYWREMKPDYVILEYVERYIGEAAFSDQLFPDNLK